MPRASRSVNLEECLNKHSHALPKTLRGGPKRRALSMPACGLRTELALQDFARNGTHMASTQSIIAKRSEQMFPVLEPHEIDRVRRFGELKLFNAGDALAEVGKVGAGLIIILSGSVDVT